MDAAVETSSLVKRYGAVEAVRGIDLRVERGLVYGLIGPNGAGKTTTLRMLLDIVRPSGGSVRVLGEDPRAGGRSLRTRIGYLPGELRLHSRVTARRMLAHLADISGPVAPGAIESLAERLGLDLDRRVRTLSKGNKQKLGLVQAFMHSPELLVLDEPTSGLDPLIQREFLAMVDEARTAGQTVLLSSHVLSEVQQAADRVAVLSAGSIVAEGEVSSLRLGSIRRLSATLADADAARVRDALDLTPSLSEIAISSAPASGGELVRIWATVEGDLNPVIRLLASHRVVDLAVEEPDLEESVLRLYGSAAPATSRDAQHRESASTTEGSATP